MKVQGMYGQTCIGAHETIPRDILRVRRYPVIGHRNVLHNKVGCYKDLWKITLDLEFPIKIQARKFILNALLLVPASFFQFHRLFVHKRRGVTVVVKHCGYAPKQRQSPSKTQRTKKFCNEFRII